MTIHQVHIRVDKMLNSSTLCGAPPSRESDSVVGDILVFCADCHLIYKNNLDRVHDGPS